MSPMLLAALACSGGGETPAPTAPEPGPLLVGRAGVRMPVPVGIGTAGYGGFGLSNQTPFSEIYPGTDSLHLHPRFDAIAISRGEGFELVFLRVDTVGVFQQLRRAVVDELKARTGKDLDDALIIGATHTHSGPGRVVDGGGVYDLITDAFFPEFYERMVDGMADAVELALADLKPGRVGIAFGSTEVGHDDRRCEDGRDYTNGAYPLVAIEQEGELVALQLAYAVHGTVLGIDQLTLSKDVAGGIEQAVADRFDHPVQVQMFNAWGADMSPAHPDLAEPGTALPGGFEQIAAVGQAMADAVEATVAELEWTETPEILGRTFRVPIDREILGYEDLEFPYVFGGVYCGSTQEPDCDPATTIEDLDQACVPFVEDYPAPYQTEITAGHLGDVQFVTFPGEPGTLLAEQVMDRMREQGAERIAFWGYSQDYLGYSILEDDWWQGGYEAGGALWGPKQGQYLADQAVLSWQRAHGTAPPDPLAPPRIEPFEDHDYEPYAPPVPTDFGTLITDVLPSYGPAETVELVVAGADPWLGTPVATLLDADGDPVLRANGAPLDSDGDPFWWHLTTTPTYAEQETAAERRFEWHLFLPTTFPIPGAVPALDGAYRLRVELPGEGGASTVESGVFTVAR